MTSPLAHRVASRIIQAAYLNRGDIVLYGKYKNKHGKIVAFGQDKWGNPTIEIEPIPRGRKQNKVFGLFKVWRADVKEKILAERAKELAIHVAARYLNGAAMTPERLQALLLKIRKGATSSLTWGSLTEVLKALDPGWKVEKFVGFVKLYGHTDPDAPNHFSDPSQKSVEFQHKLFSQSAVTFLPSNPKHGQIYVTELSPVQENPLHGVIYYFTMKLWMGHEGIRITTPSGKSQDFLPGRYDLGDPRHGFKTIKIGRMPLYDTVRWLNKETDWLDQISKRLAMPAFEPSIPRTRESTGSCPVCFQNIKVRDEKHMVLHGYRRPGTGQTEGSCFGVGFPPFETNVLGTQTYLEKLLIPARDRAERVLADFKAGRITEIYMQYLNKNIGPDHPRWADALRSFGINAENNLKGLEQSIQEYRALVAHWKVRPLPTEGQPIIDWYRKGQIG